MTDTRAAVIQTGLALWRDGCEADVTARGIGARIGVTHAGVLYSFKNAADMRDTIARAAVAQGDAVVIRKLIVAGHPAVSDMSPEMRQVWLAGA